MKIATIKSTYSLDSVTVADIERMARAWGTPKSEVIRRSVRAAAERMEELAPVRLTPVQALDAFQRAPRLTAGEAQRWIESVRQERRGQRRTGNAAS